MSVCNPLLFAAKYQEMMLASANDNNNNNSPQKIWNPAFTKTETEKRTEEFYTALNMHHRISSMLAASMGNILPAVQTPAQPAKLNVPCLPCQVSTNIFFMI